MGWFVFYMFLASPRVIEKWRFTRKCVENVPTEVWSILFPVYMYICIYVVIVSRLFCTESLTMRHCCSNYVFRVILRTRLKKHACNYWVGVCLRI